MAQVAEESARSWLAKHPGGLTAKLHLDGASKATLASLPAHLGSNLHLACDAPEGGGQRWSFNVGFSPALTQSSSLLDARDAFAWIALDRVPLTGLEAPQGWEVIPRTPVSSFKEGVEIVSFSGRRLALRVKSSFFALSGRRTDIAVPCGAPAPPGSFFQLRQDIPFDLDLDLPVTWDSATQ